MSEYDAVAGATMTSSIINTINTVIGAGMCVLPYAMRTDGIVLATVLLFVAALTNAAGMYIQGLSTKFMKPGTATFFTVCMITYPKLSIIFDFAIALQCYGVSISYLVLTGDLLPVIYTIDGWSTEEMSVLYVLASAVFVVPLTFLHKLDSLKYTSVLCLIAIAYLCLVVYYNFFYTLATHWENLPADRVGDVSVWKPQGFRSVFNTFGIMVLAYTCPNQYSIVAELRNPTISRIGYITYFSMGVCAALFFTVAFFGYLTFGNALKGNILLMFGDDLFCNFGRVLLVIMVLLSYPLLFHPARISVNNIYFAIKSALFPQNAELRTEESPLLVASQSPLSDRQMVEELQKDVPFPEYRFVWLTTVMVICSYVIALSLDSFEGILAFVGATGGTLISYVLPGVYGYKLFNTNDPALLARLEKYGGEDGHSWLFHSDKLKKGSIALVVWGILALVICLYSSLFPASS